jgi:hypothetical protein
MGTYEEFVQFARDCMRHARSASSKEIAEKLKLIAKEYQAKAAKLGNGKLPQIDQ